MSRMILLVLATSAFLAGPAGGADLPKRATGLWEEQFASSSAPGTSTVQRICVDGKLGNFLRSKGSCSREEVRKQANGYVIEAVCKQGDATVRSRTIVTGDLTRAYTAEMNATTEPAAQGAGDSTTIVKARHLGACPAGMRGGDIVTSDGTKMNLYDLEKGIIPK